MKFTTSPETLLKICCVLAFYLNFNAENKKLYCL